MDITLLETEIKKADEGEPAVLTSLTKSRPTAKGRRLPTKKGKNKGLSTKSAASPKKEKPSLPAAEKKGQQ